MFILFILGVKMCPGLNLTKTGNSLLGTRGTGEFYVCRTCPSSLWIYHNTKGEMRNIPTSTQAESLGTQIGYEVTYSELSLRQ